MIVCSTSVRSIGCTFLDWSIHFLTGQTEFFNIKEQWTPLTSNPLSKLNAHGHKKNHPSGSQETTQVITELQKHNKLTSFYPFPLYPDVVANKLNIDISTASTDQWNDINNFQHTDYNQILQSCHDQDVKIIFVSLDNYLSVYANTVRVMERLPFADQLPDSIDDIYNNLDKVLYSDNLKTWTNDNLTNIWDVRERQALHKNLIYYKEKSIDLNFNHYWVNAQNLWFNGEIEIQKIISWLNLSVIPSRLELWIPIYRNWQKLQLDALQFQYNYKHIVNCIVNNWPYLIDLTFNQEVIIQHCLIFEHGLNLKTWQLEKFPANTKELHNLLEPNIHPL